MLEFGDGNYILESGYLIIRVARHRDVFRGKRWQLTRNQGTHILLPFSHKEDHCEEEWQFRRA